MNRLKDKLYNYEVTAPASAWEKIAAALDESELENEFPKTVYNTEVTAPSQAWDKIAAAIASPKMEESYAERLYRAEVTPPVNAWEKIVANLDTVTETPVKTIYERSVPFIRYAAAAIVVGIVAFFAIRMTVGSNKDNISGLQAVQQPADSSAPNNITNLPDTRDNASAATSPAEEDEAALEASKKMLANLDQPARRTANRLNTYPRTAALNYEFVDKELSQSIYAYEEHEPSPAERYVMLMTPDGKIIRMSKQWGNLLCCVSGEDQDADCKDQLKKWQEKIATSPAALSPGNFIDILGLVTSLDETTEL